MTAVTKTHDREITEFLEVVGSDFSIMMDRHETKNDDDTGKLSECKILVRWFLRGFYVNMKVTKNTSDKSETVKYDLPLRDTVGPEGLADILSLDEKRTMLRAIDELNEWQKMNSHLPQLGDWVWRIAIDAKLSEAK